MQKSASILIALLLFGTESSSRGADTAPSIDGVCPESIYPDSHNNYSFKINGKSFGDKATTTVIFNNCDIGVTWLDEPKPDQFDRPYGVINPDHKEIELWGIHRNKYHGTVKIIVQAADISSNAKNINLSYVPAGWSKWIATGVTVLLFGLPLIILGLTSNKAYKIDGIPVTFLAALLLDPETDTFSLSKFQFYLWTLAGVFGYVFLTISRSLVQGVFQFAHFRNTFRYHSRQRRYDGPGRRHHIGKRTKGSRRSTAIVVRFHHDRRRRRRRTLSIPDLDALRDDWVHLLHLVQ